jgi:SAM-dependent methyltransferase
VFHPDGPSFAELVRQALASTERGYDMLAPKFDRTPFRTPDPVLAAMADVIGEVDVALDVCCGTGAALGHLRPLCRERLIGLDFSAGMLAEAERRLGPGRAKVELVRGDALAMPFEDEVDVVTSVGAFGHIEQKDEDRFVAGIARALRKGGRFVFATGRMPKLSSAAWWICRGFNGAMRVRNALLDPPFIMYYLTFLWPDVEALLTRHGFRVEALEGLCPAPYARAIIVVATKS